MTKDPTNQYQPQLNTVPRGDRDDGLWEDRCSGKLAEFSGIWSYRNLREQGVLKAPDTAGSGWSRYWDSSAQVPWLFNPASSTFISFEDQKSIAAKVSLATAKGLAGIAVWDTTLDFNDELISEIRKGEGLRQLPRKPPATSQTTTSPPLHIDAFIWPAKSTSSASPAATVSSQSTDNSNNGRPVIGTKCGSGESLKCMDENHRSQAFAVCASGIWVLQQCGAGTACVQSGASIYCDYHK
ncbi:hypothetical protein FBU59_001680 [Linderina macrospora]|uniref:Uncharacterized protein n=1 Tax=Linderina macrospora TaxID=4868 RepID=A0ACC1JDB6_9FUNG|nr:hypothetical protein FBU59_001680 [Linderina macrospora]